MGRLYKAPGRKTWSFKVKINGRETSWSTGESNKNKAMAVKARMEAEAQSRRELCAAPSSAKHSVKLTVAAELEVQRLREDVSERRADRVDFMLNNLVEWVADDELTLGKITTELLEDYQRARLKVRSKATVDAELTAIKCMLRNNKLHIAKPRPKQGREDTVRPFTDEELPAFFANVAPEFMTLFMTMLATGARPAEVVPSNRSTHKPLLKSEVNFKDGMVTIRSSKLKRDEKGAVRPVLVESYLLERLRKQIESTPEDYSYVFIPMTRISRIFNKAVARAGIPERDNLGAKTTAHSFRHTYATHHSENGCDQFQLMKALGHKNLQTTARYVHNTAPKVKLNLRAMAPVTLPLLPTNIVAAATESKGRVQEAGTEEEEWEGGAI